MGSEEIYQKVLLDHYKHPRHFRKLLDCEVDSEIFNALCGDRIRLHLSTDNGLVEHICFDGVGCAVAIAYTSLMIETIENMQVADAIKQTDEMLTKFGNREASENSEDSALDPLNIVTRFPMRTKCATLGWLALKQALESL